MAYIFLAPHPFPCPLFYCLISYLHSGFSTVLPIQCNRSWGGGWGKVFLIGGAHGCFANIGQDLRSSSYSGLGSAVPEHPTSMCNKGINLHLGERVCCLAANHPGKRLLKSFASWSHEIMQMAGLGKVLTRLSKNFSNECLYLITPLEMSPMFHHKHQQEFS